MLTTRPCCAVSLCFSAFIFLSIVLGQLIFYNIALVYLFTHTIINVQTTKAIVFAPDGDSGDQIYHTSHCLTDPIADGNKIDCGGKRGRHHVISFEHWIFIICTIPRLLLTVCQ